MIKIKTIKIIAFLAISSFLLNGCKGGLPGADARKFPADPAERIKKNIADGKSLQMNEIFGQTQGGVFDFASSNGLWRASLDVIDFMPLSSVNYSGGIIITDWYSENNNQKESIKISIRFMTNELRADALNIKIFNRNCLDNLFNCKVTESSGVLITELKREILKKAAIYQEQNREKKKK